MSSGARSSQLVGKRKRRRMPRRRNRLLGGIERLEDRLLLTTYFVDDDNLPSAGTGTSADPFTSIQAAIAASAAGDDVHVAPGTYFENLSMKSGVNVIGAGADRTTIRGAADVNGVVRFNSISNAELAGFKIMVTTPSAGVDRGVVFEGATTETAWLKRNVITGVQYGAFVWYPARPTIQNNTFASDGTDEQGIYIGNLATAPVVRNNSVTNYSVAGIHVVAGTNAPTPIIEYNDVHGNGTDYRAYPDQTGSHGNISSDPLFVDAPAFHLQADSPAINAGDPAGPSDPDGTRADQGAFAFGLASSARESAHPFTIDAPQRVPFELFSVTTEGTIEAEVVFSGGGHWTVALLGRRRPGLADPAAPYVEFTGPSPINISYDVAADDLARGVGWRLVVYPDPADLGATGSLHIHTPLEEAVDSSFQVEKVALRSGEHWPSTVLTAEFLSQLNTSPANQLHGFVSLASTECDSQCVLGLNGVEIQRAHPRRHQFGNVEQGVDLADPGLGSVMFFTPLEPEDKVDPHILFGDYAEFLVDAEGGLENYVLNADGTLELNVTFAQDSTPARVSTILGGLAISSRRLRDDLWAVTLNPADLSALLAYDEVEWIEAGNEPLRVTNDGTRATIHVDDVQAAVDVDGLPYDGTSDLVLGADGYPIYAGFTGDGITVAVDDSGVDEGHADLDTRVVFNGGGASIHGTHVAGIVAGSGFNSSNAGVPNGGGDPFQYRGMAPEARIVDEPGISSDLALFRDAVENHSLDVTNRSATFGMEGNYHSGAQTVDMIVSGAATLDGETLPRIPMVFAACNEGSNSPQYGDQGGYFSLGNQTKNGIIVGNWDANDLSNSSSQGPTYDGRIKPDVVAPGSGIWSTGSVQNEKQKIVFSGTAPTSGQFTLDLDGTTTANLDWDATAGEVETALENLANIGAGNVSVSGDDLPGGTLTVEFVGALAATDINLMTAANVSLDTGVAPNVNGSKGGVNTTDGYSSLGGTSMASPATAGTVALLLQAWEATYATPLGYTLDENRPLPSTIRATLAQTATDIGFAGPVAAKNLALRDIDSDGDGDATNEAGAADYPQATPGPDYTTGWGLLNAEKAVDLITDATTTDEGLIVPNRIIQGSVQDNGVLEYEFVVDPAFIANAVTHPEETLKVTMAWDDPASSSTGVSTDIRLKNDLDLELIAPDGTIFYPWQLGHRILDANGNAIADADQTPANIHIDRPYIDEPDIANANDDRQITLTADPSVSDDVIPSAEITTGGTWVARRGKDHLNNIEQVQVDFGDLQAGHWTVRVLGFDITENGRQDFSVVGTPYPDTAELIVKATNKVGISALGAALPVSFDVTNDGGTDTPAGVNIDYEILLSSDFFVGGDVSLGTGSFAPLVAGATTTVNTNVTLEAADLAALGVGDLDGDWDTDGDDLVASGAFLLVHADIGTGTPADPNDLSIGEVLEHRETNVEFLQLAPLVDVVMVFDRSGSMGDDVAVSTGVRQKIEVLMESAELFLDLLRVGAGHDRLGEVQFNDNAQTIFLAGAPGSLDDVDSAGVIANAQAAVGGLSAAGNTNIVDGLQLGLDLLTAQALPNPRQVIVFFSDGMRTAGGDPSDPAFLNQFDAAGVSVYSVGFGTRGASGNAGIDTELLETLSNVGANGFFHVTDVTPELSKFFVNAVAGAVDSQVLVDPVDTISSGDAPHRVDVTVDGEASAVTFVLAWDHKAADLDLEVVTPSGKVIKSANVAQFGEHAELLEAATHEILKVELPILTGAQEEGPGTWQMRIRHVAGVRTEYSASAISESTIRAELQPLEPHAGQSEFLPGDPVPFTLSLQGNDAVPISTAAATVNARLPLVNWGTLLAAAGITPAQLAAVPLSIAGEPLSLEERLARAYSHRYGDQREILDAIPYGSQTLALIGDGDGSFSGAFTDTRIPGSYNFTIDVRGLHACEPLQRQLAESVSVGLKPAGDPRDRPPIQVDVDDPHDTITVVVTPTTGGGLVFGPGHANDISISISSLVGYPLGGVVDGLDGSYSQTFRFFATSGRGEIYVAVGGEDYPTVKFDASLPLVTSITPALVSPAAGGQVTIGVSQAGTLGSVRGLRISESGSSWSSTQGASRISASESAYVVRDFTVDSRKRTITFPLPDDIEPGRYLVHLESGSGLGESFLEAELLVAGDERLPRPLDRFETALHAWAGRDALSDGLGSTSGTSTFEEGRLRAVTEMISALLAIPTGRNLTPATRQAGLDELIQALYQVPADPGAQPSLGLARRALNLAKIDFSVPPLAPVPTPAGSSVQTDIGGLFALGFSDVTIGGSTTGSVIEGPQDVAATLYADPHIGVLLSTTARFNTGAGVDLAFPLAAFRDSSIRAYQFDAPANSYRDVTLGYGSVQPDGNVELFEDTFREDQPALHFGSNFTLENLNQGGSASAPVPVLFARVTDLTRPVVFFRVPQVNIGTAQVAEGDPGDPARQAVFQVTLSSASAFPVTLDFQTVAGTAQGGLLKGDYQTTSGSLTFLPGETKQQIAVKIFADFVAEQDERFEVDLKNIQGATQPNFVRADSGQATIIDDDDSRLFTRDFILNGPDSVPFELFSVIEPGPIEIQVAWAGSTNLVTATLTGRRRPSLADPAVAYAQVTGVSPLTITYNVTPEDLERGVGWRLALADASGAASPYATGTMTFQVPHDPIRETQFQLEKITLDSGEFWPSAALHNQFLAGLAATPAAGQHALISQWAAVPCCIPLERLGVVRQGALQHGDSFGFVDKRVDWSHPDIAAALTFLTPLEPEDKIDPHILLGDYEAFTISADGTTAVNAVLNPSGTLALSVQFADDAATSRIQTILAAEALNYAAITKDIWRVEVTLGALTDLAAYDEVAWIGAGVVDDQPELNNTRNAINADAVQNAAITVATNTIAYNGLSGNGITVGVEDSGLDNNHNDLNIVMTIAPIGPGSHGTHVGGIIGASGVRSQAVGGNANTYQWRGVAPQAGLIDANDLRTMTNMNNAIVNGSLDLTNRSRGISYDGQYNATDLVLDQHIHGTAQTATNIPVAPRPWVVSAGNRGVNPQGNINVPLGPLPPAGTNVTTNGGQVAYFANSKEVKNAVVVGDWDAGNNRLSAGSSMGPTYDGRIKPDLVAPGTNVTSTGTVGDGECYNAPANFTNAYAACSGTSMASPAVAGVEALLLQAWQTTYLTPLGDSVDNNPPLPATLRALLIQTATDIVQGNEDADNDGALDPGEDLNGNGQWDFGVRGQTQEPDVDRDSIQGNADDRTGFAVATVGPDFATGWGLVNAGAAVGLLQESRTVGAVPVPNHIVQDTIPHLGTKTYEFVVDQAFINSNAPLKVTLAWDDVEGRQQTPTTDANRVLNVKALVHDLDLELVDPNGQVFLPWQLGHTTLAQGTLNVLANNAQPPGTAIDVQLAIAPTSAPTQVWQSNGVTGWNYVGPGAGNGPAGGTDYIPADAFQAGGVWVAQPGRDHLNNVEQVFVPNAQLTPGHWQVRVRGFDVQEEGVQEFAVVGMPYPDLPDLVASSVARAPVGGFAQNIDFTWNVINVGPMATGAAFPYEIALSNDFYWDAGTDILLTDLLAGGSQNIAALPGNNGNSGPLTSRVQITQVQAQNLVNQLGGAPDINGNGFDLADFLATDPFILVRADSPSAILEHHEENVTAVQMARLVDVVLVYDDSGSMSSDVAVSTGQRPKFKLLQDSANLFLDLMRVNFGDRLGEVRFATDLFGNDTDDVETIFVQQNNNSGSITGLTGANLPAAKNALGRLEADGGTNIHDGLQRGHDLLTGAAAGADRRRVLIFLSDGMQTAGADPTEAAFLNQFTTADIGVYSVGFGSEGGGEMAGIDTALLQQLANVAGDGFFHVTSEATDLDKFFVNAVAGATNQAVLVDPRASVAGGGSASVPVQVGRQDGEVSFIMTWDDPAVNLDLRLKTPAGATIHAGNAALFGGKVTTQVNTINNQPYEVFTVQLPIQVGADEEHGGRWEMVISNPGDQTVGYSASAIGRTTVRAQWDTPVPPAGQTTFHPGQSIPFAVTFHADDLVPISRAVATVTADIPVVGLGNLLSSGLIAPAELAQIPDTVGGEPVSLQERLVQAYRNKYGENILSQRTLPPFELDEAQSGTYTGGFPGMVPGAYGFTIDVVGTDGDCETYARQMVQYAAVGNPVIGPASAVDVTAPGGNTVVVNVTPAGSGGLVGPGFAGQISIGGSGLNPTTALIDNLDGSYTQRFTVPQGTRRVEVHTSALGVNLPTREVDVGLSGSVLVGPAGGRNNRTNTVTVGLPTGRAGEVTGINLVGPGGTIGLTGVQVDTVAGTVQATIPGDLTPGQYRVQVKSSFGDGFGAASLVYNVVGAGREFPVYVENLESRIQRLLGLPDPDHTQSLTKPSGVSFDPDTERLFILGQLLRDVRAIPDGSNVTSATRQAALDEIVSLIVAGGGPVGEADIPQLLKLRNVSQVDSRFIPNIMSLTQAGTDVQVDAGQDVTVRFGNVLSAGQTFVNLVDGPREFNIDARGKTFLTYDVSTTATFDPAAQVDVAIHYEPSDFADENSVRVYHLEDGRWFDRTHALDTVNNVIVARTQGLSPFVLLASNAVPSVSIADVSQPEGTLSSTGFHFTVSLSMPSSEAVTVSFVTTLGSAQTDDLLLPQGTVTIAPGDTDATLTVPVTGDRDYEPNETFVVTLTAATGATLDDDTGTGTLLNDDPAARSRMHMALVSQPTSTGANGEITALPASPPWIDEWRSFYVEIWVRAQDAEGAGVVAAQTDLTYHTGYFTATAIEYGPGFDLLRVGTIDDPAGLVDDLGAGTVATGVGDDQYALLARVRFEPTTADGGVPLGADGTYVTALEHGFALKDAEVLLRGPIVAGVEVSSPPTELWPTMYDIDDDGGVGFGDFAFFATAFAQNVGDPGATYAWAADFDRSGRVDFGDFAFFAANFRLRKTDGIPLVYPATFPDAWRASPLTLQPAATPPPAPAALLTENGLVPIVAEAVERIEKAAGAEVGGVLESVTVRIVDLPGHRLGQALDHTVWIDVDAAGYGWFIDATPGDDVEFSPRSAAEERLAIFDSPARGRVDLLTTVMHEFGHVLGLEHTDGADVMNELLPLGTRRVFDEDFWLALDEWSEDRHDSDGADAVFHFLGRGL